MAKSLGSVVLFGVLGMQTASASLILETFQQFSGTGLGTVPTIVTFQNVGTETGCFGSNGAGSVLAAGVCSAGGDTKTGSSQAQLQPLSAAGVTSAANFGLIFNGVQPAGGPLLVTDIKVAFYNSSGGFLYQTSGLLCQNTSGGPIVASPCLLTVTAQGTGNSGYLVALDGAQQTAATLAGAFSSTSNLVGVSSAAGGTGGASAGGSETIFLANSGGVTAVPEPAMYSMLAAGLGLLAFARKVHKA
jgi:PEP-CTERM motif